MRKSSKSVHNAVQSGLFSEDKAAEVVKQGSVKVEVKSNIIPVIVDRKGNGVFDFFLGVPAVGVRKDLVGTVRTLNRFRATADLETPSAFVWNQDGVELGVRSELCRKQAAGGLRSVSYGQWLAFYAPLNAGNRVCEVK